jgi:predicted RNA-binding Zn ribbon-like protein
MSEGKAGRMETMKLIGGELCLDFANTAGERTVNEDELLLSYQDLVEWSLHAGMLNEDEAARLRRIATKQARRANYEFDRALALREAVHRVFSAVASDRSPSEAALKTINTAAAEMLQHLQIGPMGNRFEWMWHNVRDALGFPMWAVARSATRLLVAEEISRVRECQGHGCHRLFVDWTCNRSRRWCDMATCGNREKVRQFRARRRKRT